MNALGWLAGLAGRQAGSSAVALVVAVAMVAAATMEAATVMLMLVYCVHSNSQYTPCYFDSTK